MIEFDDCFLSMEKYKVDWGMFPVPELLFLLEKNPPRLKPYKEKPGELARAIWTA